MDQERQFWKRVWRITAMVLILLPVAVPLFGIDDSSLFTNGFEAFSKGDGRKAARTLSQLLEVYPDTSLRELTLFYLARAHFRTGNQEEAARAMVRLLQEYPGTRLAAGAEKGLMELVGRYRRGEKLSRGEADLEPLPTGELAAVSAAPESGAAPREREKESREEAERLRLAAEREKAAREEAERKRMAAEAAEREEAARRRAEAERLAREKAEADRRAMEEAERKRMAAEAGRAVSMDLPQSLPAPSSATPPKLSAGLGRGEIDGPLLRVVVKSEKTEVTHGELVEYLVTLLNVGGARAEGVSLRLMYPEGEYEPVDFARSGFRNEGGGALVLADVNVDSGEAVEYPVIFRVRDRADIGRELRCTVRLLNGAVGTWDSYRSRASFVRTPRRP